MDSRRFSRQGRYAAIAGAVTLAAAIAVVAGFFIWRADGQESTLSAALIGIGAFLLIMGAAATVLFLWGVSVVRNIRAGKNLVTQWRVTPDELDRFRIADAARTAHGPDYRAQWTAPAISPPDGLDVRVAPDAVLIGDDEYFALPLAGIVRFSAVQRIADAPASLEFRIHTRETRGATVQYYSDVSTLLRVPVSPSAPDEAAKALTHFQRVLSRDIIANPGFWARRIRWGLWAVAIGAAAALGGWLWPRYVHDPDMYGDLVMITGILVILGGLFVAWAANIYRLGQLKR